MFVGIFLAVLPLIQMNREVRVQIDELATANSDSTQWALAQADVELLVLISEMQDAVAAPSAPLADLRTRFNIFYSRIQSMEVSPTLQSVRQDPEVTRAFENLQAYFDAAVPSIDSDDPTLRSALPALLDETRAVRADVRKINLSGINILSRESDAQRSGVANTLAWVSSLSLALFAVLVLAVVLLIHYYWRAQERAAEQSQVRSRLAAIISTSLDAVIAADRAGVVIDFNGAAEQIFGYSSAEAIGQRMEDLIVPEHLKEAHLRGMNRYLKTGEKHVIGKGRVQLEARRKNGEVFPVEMSVSAVGSEEGEIFVSFLRDISKRLAAEQALIKARDEAIAGEKAKADLIAVMSHEMRTPLNGMLGTLELIDPSKLSEKYGEYFDIIRASGKLLMHHVDDVLEISRAESGRIEIASVAFSLPALVRELVDSQRGVSEHRGNTLSQVVETHGVDYAVGDPIRIRQVLLNLIGNAIKFTRNGSITVEAVRLADGDLVEFRVTDTGIGIAAKDRERVFEDFVMLDSSFSRTVGGTGLGLAIVRRLVKAMDGEVGLDSTSGYGSSFWVRLPLPSPDADVPSARVVSRDVKQSSQSGPVRPMKILVVEDNEINRLIVRELLQGDGHAVDEALDGQQGVEMTRKNAYDLVFMDISMPVMDGIEATRAIRDSEPAGTYLPIVALTANAIPAERDRFLAAGLNDILIKPISLRGLRDVLGKFSAQGLVRTGDVSRHEDGALESMVDHAHLTELANALGAEKIKGLIRNFISEMNETTAYIAKCAEAGKAEPGLREKIHYATGSSALMGAEALRLALADLEARVAEGFACDASTSQELNEIWSRTAAELKVHVREA